MFLTIEDGGTTWVLDPGFGGPGPLVPVPLVEGRRRATAATCTASCAATASGCSKGG